mmetsp:Transcript_81464/g.132051  ORF Transcript_81464/g.132051 Transcript_81464/m.132051 type:complete len:86 (+) Transcript_81464:151-408(+)
MLFIATHTYSPASGDMFAWIFGKYPFLFFILTVKSVTRPPTKSNPPSHLTTNLLRHQPLEKLFLALSKCHAVPRLPKRARGSEGL